MSWEVRSEWSRVNAENGGDVCEWNSVMVESQEEAEQWWQLRVSARQLQRVVRTLWNPEGELVRVCLQ